MEIFMPGKQFSIDGYWKDDHDDTFEGYIVNEDDDSGDEDDNVFFYGMSEEEIKDAIEKGEDTVHDFVITAYSELN